MKVYLEGNLPLRLYSTFESDISNSEIKALRLTLRKVCWQVVVDEMG